MTMFRSGTASVLVVLVLGLSLSTAATSAEMYFAADAAGENRVTSVQEGDRIWIAVYDPDNNIDCDMRGRVWTDVKIMDPNTAAYIVWVSYVDENGDAEGDTYATEDYEPYLGFSGWLDGDYLEETGADTGLFVSRRSFRVGARESIDEPRLGTHVVDDAVGHLGIDGLPSDFQWGHYGYVDPDFDVPSSTNVWVDDYGWLGPRQPIGNAWPFFPGAMAPHSRGAVLPSIPGDTEQGYLLGRFENMDTLVGMYQDPNDATDVAMTMAKIIDTVAQVSWDIEAYADPHMQAAITVIDADENTDCACVEYVPVFVLVNPGTWNPVAAGSPTEFWGLLVTGGVDPDGTLEAPIIARPIRWYNIYDSGLTAAEWAGEVTNGQEPVDGTYFVQYPVAGSGNVTAYDTADDNGVCRAMFYAEETGANTGVFRFDVDAIQSDLGFNSLVAGDVLVAYYIDPNDMDDMQIGVAYIGDAEHSVTSFTDANRQEQDVYWIGRDRVYVQVIDPNANVDPCSPEQVVVHICDPNGAGDSEWVILDETSSNSAVFFSNAQTKLLPVWDPVGVGLSGGQGGYQLQLDNWKLEASNEDSVCVSYHDLYYAVDDTGIDGLGDIDATTAFPPVIDRVRVHNDVSFDVMKIADTQVFSGQSTSMWFLDRLGNRVSEYKRSDIVFVEVIDLDQNEDPAGRERVDAFWDGGQGVPFGPAALRDFGCTMDNRQFHPVNGLLGDTNLFNNGEGAKIYVLNPRSGLWAPIDLFETGVATGCFVSTSSVDLGSDYSCVPTLGALPGDTIIAFYQDPSNPSDACAIAMKVSETSPPLASFTMFTADAAGTEAPNYEDTDLVFVTVVDGSHLDETVLENVVCIGAETFSVFGSGSGTFCTAPLDLELVPGTTITATYTDPTDPTDTSSDTVEIVASGCGERCADLSEVGWHMIALPGELCGACGGASGDLCCALCDDLDPCFVFHYDPAGSAYVMVPPCDAVDASVGMGLWVYVSEATTACVSVTVPTETVCIPMQDGWNQVGDPFDFEVLLSNARICYQGQGATLEEAQTNGWISMYLFGYDTARSAYVVVMPPNGMLEPMTGYWLRAYVDCELCVDPIPAPPTPPSQAQRVDLKAMNAQGIPTPPAPPVMRAVTESVLDGLVVANEPNPVRSEHTTTFKVTGPKSDLVSAIRVEVYDLSGQLVWSEEIGAKELAWHTVNDAGELLANGVYLFRVWVKVGDAWLATGVQKVAVVR